MTMAVCFNCGEMKFGAFVDCKKCNAKPTTDDDRALSLVMTDHYFEMEALKELGARIKNGEEITLGEEEKQRIIELLHEPEDSEEFDQTEQAMDLLEKQVHQIEKAMKEAPGDSKALNQLDQLMEQLDQLEQANEEVMQGISLRSNKKSWWKFW